MNLWNINAFSFNCVACVAWQTLRDHVVRRRESCCPTTRIMLSVGRCRRHIFRFRSITFEGMHWFHSKFAEVYIIVNYRSSAILVIIRQILAELWPFFDLVFVVRLRYWFPYNKFCFRSITYAGMH